MTTKKSKLFGTPWNATEEEARKELNGFLGWGWASSIMALFIFGFMAFAGIGMGARCILLAWQKGNAGRANIVWLKTASVALVVLSALEIIVIYILPK